MCIYAECRMKHKYAGILAVAADDVRSCRWASNGQGISHSCYSVSPWRPLNNCGICELCPQRVTALNYDAWSKICLCFDSDLL
jgi:hypothetical protein